MGLKERLNAARLIVKTRAVLIKEKTDCTLRKKKMAEFARMAQRNKDARVLAAVKKATDRADDYAALIATKIRLIGSVDLLKDPTQKIRDFISDLKAAQSEAARALKGYLDAKDDARTALGTRPEGYDDKLIRWLDQEKLHQSELNSLLSKFVRIRIL
jgi:hypothetical protein